MAYSFLYLVKKIKKDYKTLKLNENAYTWSRLNEKTYHWLETLQYNGNFELDREEKLSQIADIFTKYTGVKFVPVIEKIVIRSTEISRNYAMRETSIYPEELCATFYKEQGIAKKAPKDIVDMAICKGLLKLCLDTGFYGRELAFYEYWVLENKPGDSWNYKAIKTLNLKDRTKTCVLCNINWIKSALSQGINPASGKQHQDVCPSCRNIYQNTTPPNATITDSNLAFREYHHGGRHFIPKKLTKEKNKETLFIGVEIELQYQGNCVERPSACYNVIKEQNKLFGMEFNDIYFEKDGSLGPSGVECISNPMSLEYARKYWSQMLPVLAVNFRGWDTEDFDRELLAEGNEEDEDRPTPTYGIHLTTHQDWWNNLTLARYLKFMYNTKNIDFIQALAQRCYNYNGKEVGYGSGKLRESSYITRNSNKIILKSKENNKYQSVYLKKTLIETRIFASTLNPISFMKNLEFLDAFHTWANTTSFNIEYNSFLDWLGSIPQHKIRYENLFRYLNRPRINIKDKGRIVNKYCNNIRTTLGQVPLFPNIESVNEE